MGKYDNALGNVVDQANKTVETASDSSNLTPLVYPQKGTLKLRVLFNPKAGTVLRRVRRHRVGGDQVVCLQNYGQECPVCDAVTEAETVSGYDLWKLKSNNRCIFYAQFIDSDYSYSAKYPKPKQGTLVLVVAPWTVYIELSRLIAESGDRAPEILTNNEGKIVKIIRKDEGRVSYTVEIDAWSNPYRSAENQEEFDKLLDSLDDLNDKLVPRQIDETIIQDAKKAANAIRSEYVSPSVMRGQANNNNSGSNLGSTINNMQSAQFQQQPQQQSFNTQPQQQSFNQQPQQQSFNTQASNDLMQGVGQQPQSMSQSQETQQPQANQNLNEGQPQRKINPITGEVFELVNGQYIKTGEVVSTEFNQQQQ